MSKLGMPDIIVAFKEKGIEAIQRSQRGIVMLVLEEEGKDLVADHLDLYSVDDIPSEGISDFSREQMQLALEGYQLAPKKVMAYFIPPVKEDEEETTDTTGTGETSGTEETGGSSGDSGTTSGEVKDLDEAVDDELSVKKPGITPTTMEAALTATSGTVSESDTESETTEETETTTTEKKQDYSAVLKLAEAVKFTYLVIPQIRDSQVREIASWIKSMRTVKHIMAKAVLPNCAADNEGVINFTNTIIKTKDKSYTAAEYCSRIAGMLAGTPMTIATTYAPLSELVEVEMETKEQRDARVARGEFFLFSDMQQIKVARGVNSFVTTYQGKGDQFKKCKIVELLDMIHDDIRQTGHDSYIGKYANSKENRDLLCTAITGYFKTLETEGLLEVDENEAYIDITAVKNWRMSNGLNTKDELESMDEATIKKLNLHDNVFIAADLSPLDAMENIQVNCAID